MVFRSRTPQYSIGAQVCVSKNPYANEKDISPAVKFRVISSRSMETNNKEYIYELEGLPDLLFWESEIAT